MPLASARKSVIILGIDHETGAKTTAFMSILIQIKSVRKSYGDLVILDDASASFSRTDKVGVIGRNGAGKSTLCRIITGEEELDSGDISRSPRLRLSYLEQQNPFRLEETVLEFLQRYTRKEPWQCGKIAGRFELKNELLDARIGDLPGGFQTRVKLAAMLLRAPNFLILDEPTNYLDLKTLLILEHFLRGFNGGYLIISHDREFLKRTCSSTLEVERGGLTLFPGDVEAYLEYKEEQRERALRQNRNIEAKRKHLQEFVDRYRVRAATASRAQSKLKQLDRLETIEIGHPIQSVRIRLPEVEPKKGTALTCKDLAIGYADREVARGIRFEIERGERVAVLGDNGQGKTTFLRTIAGALERRGGAFDWGHQLEPAYYAQHVYSALNPDQDIQTYLEQKAARGVVRQDILDLAGSFLFQGDDVKKPISVLSGGERARVCLAGVLLGRRPVLLLDEPTNHLDFETVEALAQALREYAGTIFFVSHDRTFVKTVATNIVEVRDGAVTLYPAGYESYVYRAQREVEEASGSRQGRSTKSAAHGSGGDSEHELRKRRRARLTRLRKEIAEAEKRLSSYAEERDAIHRHFLENPLDHSKEKQARLDELSRLVEETESLWLSRQEELEGLEGDG